MNIVLAVCILTFAIGRAYRSFLTGRNELPDRSGSDVNSHFCGHRKLACFEDSHLFRTIEMS